MREQGKRHVEKTGSLMCKSAEASTTVARSREHAVFQKTGLPRPVEVEHTSVRMEGFEAIVHGSGP